MVQSCAIVTGGSRGIGLAIARRLADTEDMRVIICGRDANHLQAVQHAGIDSVVCDVSREVDVLHLFEMLDKRDMYPAVLINNAAVGIFGKIEETTLADWKTVQAVNVRGPFLCTREAMKRMR